MNWTRLFVQTPVPEISKIFNNNFTAFKIYIDSFFDASSNKIIKPVQTTGKIKGAKGEFTTLEVDNLIVKSNFTNLYENYTTSDLDFVNTYNGIDTSSRITTSETSTNYIWPYEPSGYSWIDIETPYIKLNNDVSYGFANDNIGQEFRIILDTSVVSTSPYTFLIDSSLSGENKISVQFADAEKTYLKLIMTSYDVSLGPVWKVKEYAGNYSI